MRETQQSICEWADQAFGEASDLFRIMTRANEELAELLRTIAADEPREKIVEECADVVIVLCRAAERVGVDLQLEYTTRWSSPHDGRTRALWANREMSSALSEAVAFESGLAGIVSFQCKLISVVRELSCACSAYDGHLGEAIDSKMEINRSREWRRDGTGHGYHVRGESAAGANQEARK